MKRIGDFRKNCKAVTVQLFVRDGFEKKVVKMLEEYSSVKATLLKISTAELLRKQLIYASGECSVIFWPENGQKKEYGISML